MTSLRDDGEQPVEPEEASDEGAVLETGESDRSAGGRVSRWWYVLIAVLAVLAVVAIASLPHQLSQRREARDNSEAALRRQAVVAVSEAVVELTSPQSGKANSYVKDLLAKATGSFKAELSQMAKTLESTVQQANVKATSTVSSSAVTSVNMKEKSVVVLLTVTQNLTNKAAPRGEPRYYRMRVSTVKRHDKWLISDMRFVA